MSIRDDRLNDADRPCDGCLLFLGIATMMIICAHIIIAGLVALIGSLFVAVSSWL